MKEVKSIIRQNLMEKALKSIGFIPYWYSKWGIEDNAPAELTLVCPRCFVELKMDNKREETKDGMGDRWGFEVDSQRNKMLITDFFYCSNCQRVYRINYDKGKNFLETWVREE